MQRDQNAYLWDILNSISLIQQFIGQRNLADYSNDAMLRSAVERQLEIIGEALAQLVRRFPNTGSRVGQHSEIIAFRNRLIHGYSFVADPVVWSVIETDLPRLQTEVKGLLSELDIEDR
jgi:uncharacterized protein with HEPN domain